MLAWQQSIGGSGRAENAACHPLQVWQGDPIDLFEHCLDGYLVTVRKDLPAEVFDLKGGDEAMTLARGSVVDLW